MRAREVTETGAYIPGVRVHWRNVAWG